MNPDPNPSLVSLWNAIDGVEKQSVGAAFVVPCLILLETPRFCVTEHVPFGADVPFIVEDIFSN
jgi:hypothetical protein